MNFDETHCFSEIVIINSHWGGYDRFRMNGGQVFVVGTETVERGQSVEGQTYSIPCDQKCGNRVKFTVLHETGKYNTPGCIHMLEIMAYNSPG